MKKLKSYTPSFKAIILIITMIMEFVFILFLSHLKYFSVILFYLVLFGLIYITRKLIKEKSEDKKANILAQLILNLKGEAGSWMGIITVIFVFINLNIISNIIWETQYELKISELSEFFLAFKKGEIDFWNLNSWGIFITQLMLVFFFLIIPFDLFPYHSDRLLKEPKVLISAISLLVDKGKDVYNKDIIRKKLLSINVDDKFPKRFYSTNPKILPPKEFERFNLSVNLLNWGKWNVIRHSIEAHLNIQKIIVLSSKEFLQYLKTIDEIIEEDQTNYFANFKLENLIAKFYGNRNIEVKYSEPMEFNDFNEVKSKLHLAISDHAISKGFSDGDLIFNITGGTAQVTAAMILAALKGDRKAEYINQNTSDIVPVDVDVLTIQDLWDEIGLRMIRNKL